MLLERVFCGKARALHGQELSVKVQEGATAAEGLGRRELFSEVPAAGAGGARCGLGRQQAAGAEPSSARRSPPTTSTPAGSPQRRMGDAVRPSDDAAGLSGVVVGVMCISIRTVHHPCPEGTTE